MDPLRKLLALQYRQMRQAHLDLLQEEMAALKVLDVKAVRAQSGASVPDCRYALATTGSIEAAVEWLRSLGTTMPEWRTYE